MGISAEKLKWENTVDAAGEPECSHVKHVCETSYWTVLYFSPYYRTSAL